MSVRQRHGIAVAKLARSNPQASGTEARRALQRFNTLCGDGTGKFSKKQATMVSLGIISIPAKYNILNYAVGPVENEDLFLRSWQGIETTWYALMEQWKLCPMSKEHCPMCHLVSFFRENVDVKDSLRTRILISKARSDNTDLFRNFADNVHAIPLQDEVHGHGNIDIAALFQFFIDISA